MQVPDQSDLIIAASSLAVGAIISFFLARRFRNRTALEFYPIQFYSLLSKAAHKLDIQVSYQDKEIKNNIVLFRGGLRNIGNTDISRDAIHKPLRVILDEDFYVLSARSSSEDSNDSNAEISVFDISIIEFNWELLKPKEIIEFEALLEFKGSKIELQYFVKKLTLQHRISGLRSVLKKDSSLKDRFKNRRQFYIASIIYFLIFILFWYSGSKAKAYSLVLGAVLIGFIYGSYYVINYGIFKLIKQSIGIKTKNK